MAFESPSYAEALRRCVSSYGGAYASAVLRAPDVFEFYARLFAEPDFPDPQRPLINAVLAYFVAPHDVLADDDLGPYGLLDDLFVAAHVYQLIRREVPFDLLHRAWLRRGKSPPNSIRGKKKKDDDGDGDLDALMSMIRTESRAALGKQTKAALKMAGLG